MKTTLPTPDQDAKQLSDTLLTQIKNEIEKKGSISFARYMELALYTPGLGYYQNALKKFGREGDFVTAPEISPLFSKCLANQCADILNELNGGDIVEFGAGSGVMAADLLLALKEKKQLPNHYYIIELSSYLKTIQRETILKKMPDYIDHVVWLTSLPEKPVQGVVLANEVLDAMPVNIFTVKDGIKECGVTIENNALALCLLEKENALIKKQLENYDLHLKENYTSEMNLYLSGWIKSVSMMLSKGVVILIDYGFPQHEYYHPDRSMGTLMCHYQHHSHTDPLIFPGIQDITAHVDFTAVAEAAHDNGFTIEGYVNQAAFLINCGLLSCVEKTDDEKKRLLQNQQILKLTSPNEMGELFKVIGMSKNYDSPLLGFQSMNQLHRL